ncbi:hypothetical protein ACWGKU_34795 [Kitasatospora sp. NPDC054768]
MASITLDAERRVHADTGRVRVAAVDALRSLGFQITSEMATVVEARRGSAVRSAMLLPDQVPVTARLHLAPADGDRTAVSLHLADRAVSVIALGVQDPYVAALPDHAGRPRPGPHRPLTVCATTPRCSPPSIAPPVRILA